LHLINYSANNAPPITHDRPSVSSSVTTDNKWCSRSHSLRDFKGCFSAISLSVLDPSHSVNYLWRIIRCYPASNRPPPSGRRNWSRIEKHIVDGQTFYDICRVNVRETRTGKDILRRRTPPNSQVRQLDSTCNLIFTVVGTAQTWTLLSYSLRCDDAFIPNHRFHQKRRPHGSPNPEKRPFFQRVAHEFISEGAHSLSLSLLFFSFLRLNFDENAKNTRRSIHEPTTIPLSYAANDHRR